MPQVKAYTRVSTDYQDDEHQREDIEDLIDRLGFDDVEWLADTGSGSDREREDFQKMMDDIESGEVADVVAWELSRISRDGEDLQWFLNVCEDNGVTVHLTNDHIDKIEPDGTGRLIADIVAAVYRDERRSLVQRVNSGLRHARSEGKWLGTVPIGFKRNDQGYLVPILDPGDGEDSYLELRQVLERVDAGDLSYSKAADRLHATRQTISNVMKSDRRDWYLESSADDERVQEAIDRIDG